MASTFTTNLNLELQGTGDNTGTWGTVLNTAALTIVDNAIGGVQSLTLSNVNVTITTTQSQNNAYALTGTLTGNVIITWPNIGRTYFVANNTTGNFTVTLARLAGGTTSVIRQGRNGFYVLSSSGVTAQTIDDVPTGAVTLFAMSSVPTGYLECDGTAVSRTTYAALFAAISTTYGSGDGSTTFNLPDLRGYFARGWDHGRGVDTGRVFGSTQTSANLQHNHTGTAADHTHVVTVTGTRHGANGSATSTLYGANGDQFAGTDASVTSQGSGLVTLTIANSGGTESRPVNIAMLYAIKT